MAIFNIFKNLFKKVYYFLIFFIKFIFSYPAIAIFDSSFKKKFMLKNKNSFIRKGWTIKPINKVFPTFKKELFLNESLINIKTNNYGNYVSHELSENIYKFVLESDELIKIVHSYLGKVARLDDIYLWKKENNIRNFSKEDISCAWHTDNVGHRLKLFIPIELSEHAPYVEFIKNSHYQKYKLPFIEMLRFFGIFIDNHKNSKIDKLKINTDQLFFFDTNSTHRDYIYKEFSYRNCLILEFINPYKSNYISGFCPCGPAQNRNKGIFFPASCKNYLFNNPLIDKKILGFKDKKFYYSISNI